MAEIHVHDGHLAGFSYAAIEYEDINDATDFEPPSCFGRKVT